MMEAPLFFFHEERRECTWDTPPETTLENPHWPLPLPLPSSSSSSLSLLNKEKGSSGSSNITTTKEDNRVTLTSPTPTVSQGATTLGGATTTAAEEETDAGAGERTEVDAVAPREGAFLGEGDAPTNIGRNSGGNGAVVVASPAGAAGGAASVSAGGEGREGESMLGPPGDGSRHRSTCGEVPCDELIFSGPWLLVVLPVHAGAPGNFRSPPRDFSSSR